MKNNFLFLKNLECEEMKNIKKSFSYIKFASKNQSAKLVLLIENSPENEITDLKEFNFYHKYKKCNLSTLTLSCNILEKIKTRRMALKIKNSGDILNEARLGFFNEFSKFCINLKKHKNEIKEINEITCAFDFKLSNRFIKFFFKDKLKNRELRYFNDFEYARKFFIKLEVLIVESLTDLENVIFNTWKENKKSINKKTNKQIEKILKSSVGIETCDRIIDLLNVQHEELSKLFNIIKTNYILKLNCELVELCDRTVVLSDFYDKLSDEKKLEYYDILIDCLYIDCSNLFTITTKDPVFKYHYFIDEDENTTINSTSVCVVEFTNKNPIFKDKSKLYISYKRNKVFNYDAFTSDGDKKLHVVINDIDITGKLDTNYLFVSLSAKNIQFHFFSDINQPLSNK